MSIDRYQRSPLQGFANENIPSRLGVSSSSVFENSPILPKELPLGLAGKPTWDRLARQIVSELHASLDTQIILQTIPNLLVRSLSASMCFVVEKQRNLTATMNHLYANSSLESYGKPLPQAIIRLGEKLLVFSSDISAYSEAAIQALIPQEDLFQSGVRAIACKSIFWGDTVYGIVFVVQTDQQRIWQESEITLLELVTREAGVALHHAREHAQVKEQLLNMSLVSNLAQRLTSFLDYSASINSNAIAEKPSLTPLSIRELEVLKLIASGLANREIAQKLFLTESTVELHASRVRKKLKLKSRTALVKYACDNRLV